MVTKSLLHLSRIAVGAIFVFSGFVKAIDPYGSAYKFGDYFMAFGMGWMEPMTFSLGVLLSTLEFAVGLMLLTNICKRLAEPLALAFMAVFTPVTLYLAMQEWITGHEMVSDCGCFGDAWVLTNWETFTKNLIILIPAIYLFAAGKQIPSMLPVKIQKIIGAGFAAIGILLSVHAYRNLPPIDFRPYKIGSNIQEGMTIPEDAPKPRYETFLYYKKDGITQEFTIQDYPRTGDWEFVDSKNILIEKGYQPPIKDFTIICPEVGEVTSDVLDNKGYTFLVVAWNLPKFNLKYAEQINSLHRFAKQNSISFRVLTSSMPEDIERFRDITGATYEFCVTDPITLKTIVRANPGIVLLKDATVAGKWHPRNLPQENQLRSEFFSGLQPGAGAKSN
jgi:uncharacterized membrane protein YphA (DoxX/SURF4 family)